ncbi:MAG: hypothetical protein V1838_01025 [Patescibacteria group bacterium]
MKKAMFFTMLTVIMTSLFGCSIRHISETVASVGRQVINNDDIHFINDKPYNCVGHIFWRAGGELVTEFDWPSNVIVYVSDLDQGLYRFDVTREGYPGIYKRKNKMEVPAPGTFSDTYHDGNFTVQCRYHVTLSQM